MLATILIGVIALVLAKVVGAVAKAREYKNLPGYYGVAFWRLSLLLRWHKWWAFNEENVWADQAKSYNKYGLSGYMIRSLWSGQPTLVINDPEGAKQAYSSPTLWTKPLELYGLFSHFGPSLLITEGEPYKRHRRAAGPAFGEGFNNAMWDAGIEMADEWRARLPKANSHGQKVVEMAGACRQITLMVIAKAGFGLSIDWDEWSEEVGQAKGGGELKMIDTLRGTVKFLLLNSLLPKLTWQLPFKSARKVDKLFTLFESRVLEIVDQRRTEEQLGVERNDLLSRLIHASDSQSPKDKLTEKELLANIHIFLVAGFATTAFALTAALMFLALYPEHQDAVAKEAREVLGPGGGVKPGYDKFSELKSTTGALLEAMRLYPLVLSTGKVAAADTSITLHTVPTKPGESGVPVNIPISKGTHLRIDVPGVGLNTEYWGEDVMAYRPSRFVDTDDYKWPRDAFVAFSGGMRACIGRQSAIVEGTAVLARIVSQFRVEPPAEVADKWALRAGESEFERRKRVYMPFVNQVVLKTYPLDMAFVPRE